MGLPGMEEEPYPLLEELVIGLPGVELVPGYVVPQDSPAAVVVEYTVVGTVLVTTLLPQDAEP